MAKTLSEGSHWRRNSKLETFLKRNLDQDAYEQIRAYEPCVVVSETLNKVFMHVVLSDECIYLTEFPPRTLRQAVHYAHILDIEMINDLPDFLSGTEREQSLHIRIVHTSSKETVKRSPKHKNTAGPRTLCSQHYNYGVSPSMNGIRSVLLSTHLASSENTSWIVSSSSTRGGNYGKSIRESRSASCPANPSSLGRGTRHQVLAWPSFRSLSGFTATQLWPPAASPLLPAPVLARLVKRQKVMQGEEEEKEAELHLYALSPTSRIYLHLQSSWNSYIMRSTLMLDPLKCNMLSFPSSTNRRLQKASWERTSHLFNQLIGELLQEKISLESLYLLIQELCTAAQRNPAIKKLFWRSPEVYPFLVKTLAESSWLSLDGLNRVDRLLLCTLVVQTLSVMFREMELEPACRSMLTSKLGGVTAAMLLALVCDPELPSGQAQSYTMALQAEYLDAASVLLYEVVVFCLDASCSIDPGHFLTMGWVFRTLKPHPFLPQFMGYQAKQVILVLSDEESPLSPSQAVLLYQRCRVLLACLHYNTDLHTYITSEFKEEFRYYVRISELGHKLCPHYPIRVPTERLIIQLLSLMLHKS